MHTWTAEAAEGFPRINTPEKALGGSLVWLPTCTIDPYLTAACAVAWPLFLHNQTLAYAVARLPSCYAAAHRIFKELAVRYPGFEPKTLLDFGAGPGTATWAAQEVCPL
jgi:hypothetical protein